jgi:arginase
MMPGTENDAPAYHEALLCERLAEAGCTALDVGDLEIPSYLPHHTVPPIRNWPGPRIVWDLIAARIQPLLSGSGHLPLLTGCDCSVVVGTVQALTRASDNVHVLYIDGDFDDAPPDPGICRSAAAMAVWLITNPSPFWPQSPLEPHQVTVVGWSKPSFCPKRRVNSMSLMDIRRTGPAEAARSILESIPESASILVHFDIDVLADKEFPAAYFPHSEGLTMEEMDQILGPVLSDPRVRLMEISEYSALRDLDRLSIRRLIGMIAANVSPRRMPQERDLRSEPAR